MSPKINDPETLKEVQAAFERYERALVGNDIAELDALFWQSEQVVRLGAFENLYGFAQIQEFRKNRSPVGLTRTLANTTITTFGTGFASATTEFTREGSTLIGRQTHSWVRFPDGWKIVAAHVSNMSPLPGGSS